MTLKDYFEKTKGLGILSTANRAGVVDSAVYSRPHVMDDGSLAFIMRDRLTHGNVTENPHAMYLFKEDGTGYNGKRLFLTRIREEKDTDLLFTLKRRPCPEEEEKKESRYLVFFTVDKEVPLVGAAP